MPIPVKMLLEEADRSVKSGRGEQARYNHTDLVSARRGEAEAAKAVLLPAAERAGSGAPRAYSSVAVRFN
jgi:hypothetical protein